MWAVFRLPTPPPPINDNECLWVVFRSANTPPPPPQCEQCSGLPTPPPPHQWMTIQWMWAVFRSASSCQCHANTDSMKDNTMNVWEQCSDLPTPQSMKDNTIQRIFVRGVQVYQLHADPPPPHPTPSQWMTIQWVFMSSVQVYQLHADPPTPSPSQWMTIQWVFMSSVQVYQLHADPPTPPPSQWMTIQWVFMSSVQVYQLHADPPTPPPSQWRTIQWIFVSNALAWQDLRNKICSTHGDIHVLNHLPKSENIICSPQKTAWRYTTSTSRAQSLFLTTTFVRLSVLPYKFLTHLVPDHPSPPALLPSCATPDRPVVAG